MFGRAPEYIWRFGHLTLEIMQCGQFDNSMQSHTDINPLPNFLHTRHFGLKFSISPVSTNSTLIPEIPYKPSNLRLVLLSFNLGFCHRTNKLESVTTEQLKLLCHRTRQISLVLHSSQKWLALYYF